MAQLVKLLDYVSRYEHDLSRYPTQYIRLKRYQWERMKVQWENGVDLSEWQQGIRRRNRMNRKREDGFPLFSGCLGNGKTVIGRSEAYR